MEQGTVAWHRFETLEHASQALAEAVAIRLRVALAERGSALIAVPGGTTPSRFLAALGGHDLDWDKVTILPTDERDVAPNDPASNEAMIRASLSPLREGRAHFLSFHAQGGGLDDAASALSDRLSGYPQLDILVSGMGADGHIASLFPGEAASGRNAPDLHVVAARPPGLPQRLSLSAARLAGADFAALLVSGGEKAQTLATAQSLPAAYPVGLLLGRRQGLDVYWAKG